MENLLYRRNRRAIIDINIHQFKNMQIVYENYLGRW